MFPKCPQRPSRWLYVLEIVNSLLLIWIGLCLEQLPKTVARVHVETREFMEQVVREAIAPPGRPAPAPGRAAESPGPEAAP